MTDSLTKKEILNMIKSGKVAPEEALKMYKELEQAQNYKAETFFYTSSWKEKELTEQQAGFLAGNVMLFCTDENAFKQFKKSLEPRGLKSIGVLPGDSYERLSEDMYKVNPACGEDFERLVKELSENNALPLKIVHMWSMDDNGENLQEYVNRGIFTVFYLTREYMKNKVNGKVKLVYANKTLSKERFPQHEAMDGFFRSLYIENTRYMFKLLYFRQNFKMDSVLKELEEESFDSFEVKYIDGMRFIKVREEKEHDANMPLFLPLMEKGVYLITGGAKGLGLIFAEYMARKYKAKLVLTGRADIDEQLEIKINELKALGGEVVYIKADVSDKTAVEELIKKAKKHFKNINGIIHSAGTTRDSFIFKKTKEDIDQVLAPKVFGTVNLDNALKDENLDFFVMFSSINGITGNAGQCDYAYANRFMDSFSRRREVLRKDKKRFGKTVSINWSPWKEGGMAIPEDDREIFVQKTGFVPLIREVGIKIFEAALGMNTNRCIAAYGIRDRLKAHITGNADAKQKHTVIGIDMDRKVFLEKTESFLKNIFSDLLRIPVKRLDPMVTFQEYGIDSVMVNRFNYEIEQKTGPLPKTILFECQNISELAEYLIGNHREALANLFNGDMVKQTGDKNTVPKESNSKVAAAALQDIGKNTVNESKSNDNNYCDEIAVIGISGRYPQAGDCEELWQNLISGRDSITEIPASRWDYRKYYDQDPQKSREGSMYCKWGGFIDGADNFDPAFFNISPREAEVMDPQERIFVETVWSALEDAGYSLKSIRENAKKDRQADVGVFVGVTTNSYMLWGPSQLEMGNADIPQSFPWSIANRISFLFNFNGPSIPIDTACSSSLTAIHLACESLKRGECSAAVAGGVNLYLHPIKYIILSQMNMLSPSGKCYSFGEKADGFVPGEGVGAVILKPLTKAVKDKDSIYAVIRGSAINHGGLANGYTVPNPAAQANVIRETLRKANISARTMSYIEAHGTGTSLGDPIEVAGLTKAFREHTQDTNFCAIGSLKSNIGHLEAAAGIASLTKVLLQLKYKKLVPSLHAEKLNPKIDFVGSPLYVQKELSEWKQPVVNEGGVEKTYPRRAGISSFGAGGANAHIIMEEFEREEPNTDNEDGQEKVVVLSAKNIECLKAYAQKMCAYLEKSTARDGQGVTTADLKSSIKSDLSKIACDILKISENDVYFDIELQEHGFDQVSIIELVSKINEKYKINLTQNVLFLQNTFEKLTSDIQDECGRKMQEYCCKGKLSVSLADFAYTLQVGREPLDERIAFKASSFEEVIEVFKAFYSGSPTNKKYYTGNLKDNKESGLIPESDEAYVKSVINSGDFGSLAGIWAAGADINWNLMYEVYKPSRISLPAYPFQRRRYWIGNFSTQSIPKPIEHEKKLHDAGLAKTPANEGVYSLDIESELKRFAASYNGDEVKMDIIDGRIAVIVMQDRENSNMLTGNLYHGLVSKFHEIQDNCNIRAVVLTGFDNVFCMGGTQDNLTGIASLKGKCSDGTFIYKGLLSCKVPVIAAIQGHAMGGGLIFGLFADIIVMSNESVFSANFTRYGFTPGVGATYVLKDKLGSNLAMEMMFTAKEYRGDELKERGASFIFKNGSEVLNEALTIAGMLAQKPLNTLKVLKEELSGRVLEKLPDIIEREVNMHRTVFTQPGVEEVKQRIEYYFNASNAEKSQSAPLMPFAEAKTPTKLILKDKTKNDEYKKVPTDDVNKIMAQKVKPIQLAGNTDAKTKVAEIIGRILRIPLNEINLKLSVKELGMDSISGVEFIRDINKTFDLNLEAVILYDFPNILSLIKHIDEELKSRGFKGSAHIGHQNSGKEQGGTCLDTPKAKITLKNNESWSKANTLQTLRDLKDETAASTEIKKAPVNKYVQPAAGNDEFVKDTVLKIISNILHIQQNEVNLKLSVKELGMDSISGVELIRDINRNFGLNLEAVMLYDFPNIKKLIDFVLDEVKSRSSDNLTSAKETVQEVSDDEEERIIELLRKLKDDDADIDEVDQRLEDML